MCCPYKVVFVAALAVLSAAGSVPPVAAEVAAALEGDWAASDA